jgi:hypothetical protein
MDAKFNEDEYLDTLEKNGIPETYWLLGSRFEMLQENEKSTLRLREILQHPYYQNC